MKLGTAQPVNRKHFAIVTITAVVSVLILTVGSKFLFNNAKLGAYWIIPFLIWITFNSTKGKIGKNRYGPLPFVVAIGLATVAILFLTMPK